MEKIKKTTPMGKLGTPEEIADLVLFLVSDASSYINGATICIDACMNYHNNSRAKRKEGSFHFAVRICSGDGQEEI